jgi:hypothetical protein
VHVDIDPREIGKNKPVHCGLVDRSVERPRNSPCAPNAHVDSPARGEQHPQLSPALRRLSVIDRRKGIESGQDARSVERKSFASAVLHGDTAIE